MTRQRKEPPLFVVQEPVVLSRDDHKGLLLPKLLLDLYGRLGVIKCIDEAGNKVSAVGNAAFVAALCLLPIDQLPEFAPWGGNVLTHAADGHPEDWHNLVGWRKPYRVVDVWRDPARKKRRPSAIDYWSI